MTRVATRSKLTADEYLAWERVQPDKHEFFDGEVFAMAGGSFRHNWISGNVLRELSRVLVGCFTFTSDQRVGLDDGKRFVYPDVSVVCGAIQSRDGTTDVLLNPTVIVEVLSTSTEPYDRGLKWEGYQRLSSLSDYLLVSQHEVRVEQFQRAAGGRWSYQTYGPGESVLIADGAALEVDAVYVRAFELAGD